MDFIIDLDFDQKNQEHLLLHTHANFSGGITFKDFKTKMTAIIVQAVNDQLPSQEGVLIGLTGLACKSAGLERHRSLFHSHTSATGDAKFQVFDQASGDFVFAHDLAAFKVGTRVRHDERGEGEVEEIDMRAHRGFRIHFKSGEIHAYSKESMYSVRPDGRQAKDSHAEELHAVDRVWRSHKVFQNHATSQLPALLHKMQRMELRLGDTLFNVGDSGSSMFILLEGELAGFTRDRVEVTVLKPGTILGELAALRLNAERTLTIKAKSAAVVYSLWADDLEQSLVDLPEAYNSLREAMKHSALQNYKLLEQEKVVLQGGEKGASTTCRKDSAAERAKDEPQQSTVPTADAQFQALQMQDSDSLGRATAEGSSMTQIPSESMQQGHHHTLLSAFCPCSNVPAMRRAYFIQVVGACQASQPPLSATRTSCMSCIKSLARPPPPYNALIHAQ